MKIHKLKLDIAFCDAVLNGLKTFEIRKNDRGFQRGDLIRFIPTDNIYGTVEVLKHDIIKKEYEITYLLSGWGLKKGYVALAIREVKENDM